MEEVCSDPCCSVLLFPFLRKYFPQQMNRYLPFEHKKDQVKKGSYIFQHDMLYDLKPSTFDPSKIQYKASKNNLKEVKQGINIRISKHRTLMKGFSLTSLILFIVCIVSLFTDTIWGIKLFYALTSVFFFGATYVMRDEAVTKMKLYLMSINGDIYLEKKYKWVIHDDGCTMELEIDDFEPENDEESKIVLKTEDPFLTERDITEV